MKILYLITKSNWGGAQKYVYDLATAFHARKCDVAVAFGGKGELYEKLHEAGIRTISLDSLQRDIHIGKELKSIVALYKILKEEKPEVLHLNSSKASGIGAFLGRVLGVPRIVFTIHGAPFREDRSAVMRSILYIATWATCVLSHKVIAVSNRDAHDVGRMFFVRSKVSTIYSGISFDMEWKRTKEKSREVNVLTVAELHPNKGYIYGLQAIDNLYKKGVPLTYTIFGEGEDREKIEQFINDKGLQDVVSLRGHSTELYKEWCNYDLFLLPSIKEGLPYTLIEAGKAMLPVVSSVTGGIPEIIRHEETGLLVRPKDIDGISSAIERLATDRNFAKKLGINLHSHVVQNFSHSKMLAETGRVYGLIKPVSS
jgi:glycosyltransferase involved in cell wall biosynthesis